MYTFDMVLKAAVTVEADSKDEALRIVEGVIQDASTAKVFEGDPEDPDDELTLEVSLAHSPTLSLIDGEDVDDALEDDPDDEPCPVNRRPKCTCPSGCTHGEA